MTGKFRCKLLFNRWTKISVVSILLLSGSYLNVNLKAQDLPEQLRFNEDTSRLIYGGIPSQGFYDEGVIESVYLDFFTEDFWDKMLENHDTEDYVLAVLRFGDKAYDSVAVQFKGQTSFTKPAADGSEKLSFSIKLDEHIEGQDIEGYNNFNFNNAFQDFSFMREVLYGKLSRDVGPALKGNFIRLFLNGEDWGLYTNIQQLNGDYIKEWYFDKDGIRWRADAPTADISTKAVAEPPGGGAQWGDGTAALNYLGESIDLYQKYYTLKDSDMENPREHLIRVCNVLNTTPRESLIDSLEEILDIDATLWFLAREIAFSDDDSYIYKGKMDYYLYLNEETGKMTPLEFDGNSAMSARNKDWSPFINEENENYPLLNILLSVPELRQRYIAHMKTLLLLALNPEKTNALIDNYETLIAPELMKDPKIDFLLSDHIRDMNRLKYFFNYRSSYILSDSEFQFEEPEITEVVQWQDTAECLSSRPYQNVEIKARAFHSSGIKNLNLYYSSALTGDFKKVQMNDAGSAEDETAIEGIYSAIIPGHSGGSVVRYYIEAVAADSMQTVSYMPGKAEYEVFVYKVSHMFSENPLIAINELMASNESYMVDEAGEFDDWIELYNLSPNSVSLKGYHLSDDSGDPYKWMMPDTTISGEDYIIVWADDDEEQGKGHTNFKLSADGEELVLTDADSAIVDRIDFSIQLADRSYGRWPNGTGSFMEMPASFHEENTLKETAIPDGFSPTEFEIYPNPADDVLFISCANEDEVDEIQIFNSTGKVILSEKFNPQIDISYLDPGIYVLKSGANVKKLVKR